MRLWYKNKKRLLSVPLKEEIRRGKCRTFTYEIAILQYICVGLLTFGGLFIAK